MPSAAGPPARRRPPPSPVYIYTHEGRLHNRVGSPRGARLSRTTKRGSLVLLAGLFLASLALRPQLVGVGPLLSTIQHNLRVSHSVAGLLSTAIVLCMGLFAPVAFLVARRTGQRWAIAGALALIAIFGVARAEIGPPAAVILLTVPVGIGIAVAGSLMPLVVRESWPGRPVL